MKASAPIANPGVPFPPPILFVGGFGFGWLVDRKLRPLALPGIGANVAEPIGLALIVVGFALMAWGIVTFHRRGTAVYPNQPASSLVTDGPYRFTRNPMYTGMTVAYLGGSLVVGSLWPIVLLPVVLVLLVRLVVRREEAYLENAFGKNYEVYRATVRRWL